MVELEGSRTLVPACSRKVEAGMVIRTDSERVRHSRRLVRTRSESVWTTIPSSTLREHAGTSVREPSSSTTQTRHTFTGVSVSP